MISGDNPPKYCRWCGTRMPAPGMHEGSFKSETDCELEAVKSKLDEQVRLREMAESFLRTAIEINEKNTSRLDSITEDRDRLHDERDALVLRLQQWEPLAFKPARSVDDGFGNVYPKCGRENCALELVRPGKVQCEHPGCGGLWQHLRVVERPLPIGETK
jgi:hypothetical protein